MGKGAFGPSLDSMHLCTYLRTKGSVYKKADPKSDIDVKTRDTFWNTQEVNFIHCKPLFVGMMVMCVFVYVCVCVCVVGAQKDSEKQAVEEKRFSAEAKKKEEMERKEREVCMT